MANDSTYFEILCLDWAKLSDREKREFTLKKYDSYSVTADSILSKDRSVRDIWNTTQLLFLRKHLPILLEYIGTSDFKIFFPKSDEDQSGPEKFNKILSLVNLIPQNIKYFRDFELFNNLFGVNIFLRKLAYIIRNREVEAVSYRFVRDNPELVTRYIEKGPDSIKILGTVPDDDSEVKVSANGTKERTLTVPGITVKNDIWYVVLPKFATEGRVIQHIKSRVNQNGLRRYVGYSEEEEYIDKNPQLIESFKESMKNRQNFRLEVPSHLNQRLLVTFLKKKALN